MNIASIGIDLGKTTFHLVALDHFSKVVIRKQFSSKQLLASQSRFGITSDKPCYRQLCQKCVGLPAEKT